MKPHDCCISYVVGTKEKAAGIYLHDGTKIMINRDVNGRVWMEVKPQDVIKIQGKAGQAAVKPTGS